VFPGQATGGARWRAGFVYQSVILKAAARPGGSSVTTGLISGCAGCCGNAMGS